MKRFYRNAAVEAVEDGCFAVLLDGKPVKTPRKKRSRMPRALAEAVAAEWNAQGEAFEPAEMILVKCVNTAVDHVVGKERIVIDGVMEYANDLLCYRSDKPDLAAEQAAAWNPLLDWAAADLGARLKTGVGIVHIGQDPAALDALRRKLETLDAFALTALCGAAAILGSLVLALAIAGRRLTPEKAFALSRIDEAYQTARWGRDEEAERRAGRLEAELKALSSVLLLVRQ
jgi:chaperone required for assembly of F1-ATPase